MATCHPWSGILGLHHIYIERKKYMDQGAVHSYAPFELGKKWEICP